MKLKSEIDMKANRLWIMIVVLVTVGLAACTKDPAIPTGKVFNASGGGSDVDEEAFVGTWGVEKLDYYNIDNEGNPIASTLTSYNFDPSSTDNGIQLVFREDKTGEMRDSTKDTLWMDVGSYIYCPDTTIAKTFTYSFDNETFILKMNMDDGDTYNTHVQNLTDDAFIYENEYQNNFVEKAYLKRLSNEPYIILTDYTVSVSANPSAGGTVSGGGTYQQGQNCTVTATANSGYTFTNWTENGTQVSTNANYTFIVTSNRTLVAVFTAVTPPSAGEVQVMPYAQSFVSEFGTYMTYDIAGQQRWEIDYSTAKMSGYANSTNYANEDWLISSPVAITGVSNAKMTMLYIARYFNNLNEELTIWASENYTWGNSPASATWTQVPSTLSEGDSWSYFLTTEISLTQFVG